MLLTRGIIYLDNMTFLLTLRPRPILHNLSANPRYLCSAAIVLLLDNTFVDIVFVRANVSFDGLFRLKNRGSIMSLLTIDSTILGGVFNFVSSLIAPHDQSWFSAVIVVMMKKESNWPEKARIINIY